MGGDSSALFGNNRLGKVSDNLKKSKSVLTVDDVSELNRHSSWSLLVPSKGISFGSHSHRSLGVGGRWMRIGPSNNLLFNPHLIIRDKI